MKLPKLSAFTFIELLIVVAISGIILTAFLAYSAQARYTFLSNQTMRSLLLDTRVIRRRSMLITRKSEETGWVHGIGYMITDANTKTGRKIEVVPYKIVGIRNSRFYEPYPENLTKQTVNFINITDADILNIDPILNIKYYKIDNSTYTPICSEEDSYIFIVFESVNGRMHAYCNEIEIVAEGIAIGLDYTQNTINILQNGDISIKQK